MEETYIMSRKVLKQAAVWALLASGTALAPVPVAASLIGDSIRGCLEGAGPSFPFCDTSPLTTGIQFTDVAATVADPGVEFEDVNSRIKADFDADSLTISVDIRQGQIFVPFEWVFEDLDWGIEFDELKLLPGNSFSVDSFAFTQDTITILTPAQSLAPDQFFATLSATFQIQQSIPEPATLALFGLGLAGLAGLGRRRYGGTAG